MKNGNNDGDEKVEKQFLTPEARERIHKALDELFDEAPRGITLSATCLRTDGSAKQLAVVCGRFSPLEGVYAVLESAEKTLKQLDTPKALTAAQGLSELMSGLLIAFHIVDDAVKAKAAQDMENVT